MVKMLKALMGKEKQHAKKDNLCKQRDENSKIKVKRNARIRNIVTEIKHAFSGLTGRPDVPSKEPRTQVNRNFPN